MWISILLVVLLVLPAEGRADGKVAVGEPGREAQGPCLGRPLPLQVRCHRRLWCLVRVRAVQVFIYFTDLTSNTLFLPLSVSNLELKPFHYSLYFSILEYLFSIFSNSLLKSSILSFQFPDYKEHKVCVCFMNLFWSVFTGSSSCVPIIFD